MGFISCCWLCYCILSTVLCSASHLLWAILSLVLADIPTSTFFHVADYGQFALLPLTMEAMKPIVLRKLYSVPVSIWAVNDLLGISVGGTYSNIHVYR